MINSKNIIFDTDLFNEADDYFALTYLLKKKELFNVKAVTISPFKHSKYEYSISQSIEDSYNEAITIYDLLGIKDKSNIYKGSIDYYENGYTEDNDAVNKIIELAHTLDSVYVIAVSGLTNIALAIKKDPSILNKIKVIWLGSNFLFGSNQDSNFRRDVLSVKTVFESKVDLTVIPTSPISSNLLVSIYEIESKLKGKSDIADYLYYRFKYKAHGIDERWPLYDVAAVAYLVNEDWFSSINISCPYIDYDNKFIFTNGRHNVKFVSYLKATKILDDMFKTII